ncbi:CopD family protein [Paraburkholderia madseniana]|uniref:CopD family protein n=1 Tax=Paraburkholderia madseniana TaxID=2599607 RepID=A0AAP5BCU3_9BURK|nr:MULTISPECIES: CopD family protein [Paraburkholderia]MCX4146276.1 CopD family protein [Paraburkholderia madseniana]MDN7149222.1 CopD family protein [Paraburkholderia sp. WS6]MDQ6408102.1 CopD family protein [Paraburkholderia madseniana]
MDPLVVVEIVVAAAQDMLFAVAVGALACGTMLRLQEGPTPTSLVRWQLGALSGLTFTCGLYLWLQAAVVSGSPLSEAGPLVTVLLTQSHFGVASAVSCAGAILGIMGSIRGTRCAALVTATGLIVYAAGRVGSSHAADGGDFTLAEVIHFVHLCGMALWSGSVIVAAFVLSRWDVASSRTIEQRADFCVQLSHLATVSLGVVVVSGIYNATQDTAHLAAPLLSVQYGRVLTLKLVLVTLVVLLGGTNRMLILPQLQAASTSSDPLFHIAQRRFGRLLILEAVAMLAVLATAAMLGHTSPSAG